MKYSILVCVNGNFKIEIETSDLNNAKVNFHSICQNYWNAPDVLSATVKIVDENLDCVEGYKEFITHEPQPEPTPEVIEDTEE